MNQFEELGLSDELLGSIERLGFSQPTKIQKDSIPYILEGKDVIGESETGSGKTLAFGCGIVTSLSRGEGIRALVLTPTRELAEQVKESLKELTFKPRLNVAAVYGGVSLNGQIRLLRRADVVVATPGRLLDHIHRDTIDLRRIEVLVMDEADRMFDMGFIGDVEKIIARCPKKRQTLFFSATISPEVKNLSQKHMKDPETVMAGKFVDPEKLKQITIDVTKKRKFSLLTHLLKQDDTRLSMVFCNTRHISNFVEKNLRSNGINAAAIHGGLTQNRRHKTLNRFNSNEVNVLVCTDVAARGLHIQNVSHVINYDMPRDPNDYIHRIGRTARAGESGQVINLLTSYDSENMSKVLRRNRNFNIENQELLDFSDAPISGPNRSGYDNRRNSGGRKRGRNGGGNNGGKRNWRPGGNGQNGQRSNNGSHRNGRGGGGRSNHRQRWNRTG